MLGYVATFFAFSALVLEVFTLLGNTYNQPFLKSLYFAQIVVGNTTFVDFGLWSYCTGTIRNDIQNVTLCSAPVPAFNWANVTSQARPYLEDLSIGDKVYLTNFILYWIVFGLTLGALVITLMNHFGRASDMLAAFGTFIAFVVMLVVLIIVLVISIRAINAAKEHNVIAGHLGPSTWMTLGSTFALLFSSFWYCFACICHRRRAASTPPE